MGYTLKKKKENNNNHPASPFLCCSMTLASYPLCKGRDAGETDRSCLIRKLSAVLMVKG